MGRFLRCGETCMLFSSFAGLVGVVLLEWLFCSPTLTVS